MPSGIREMFNGSHNFTVSGGNFNNIGGNLTYISSEENERGLCALLQYTSTSATYNAEARFPPPLCHPGTREAILGDLKSWANSNAPDDAIIWLYGPAGAGKSAIAQTFAEACARNGTLVGSFFFWHTDTSRNNPQMLFTTIAYQMAMSIPELRPKINAMVINDFLVPTSFIEKQFNDLILQPMLKARLLRDLKLTTAQLRQTIPIPLHRKQQKQKQQKVSKNACNLNFSSPDSPRVLIIDGLDECSDSGNQQRILSIIGEAMQKYNLPLRILIASRPERSIKESFRSPKFENICHWIPLDDTLYQASLEIRKYLQDRFDEIWRRHSDLMIHVPRPWPTSQQIEYLVEKASGQFIYPSTVLKYIDDSGAVPADRLNIVLGLPTEDYDGKDSPFASLDALYLQILSSSKNLTILNRTLAAIVLFRRDIRPGIPFSRIYESMPKLAKLLPPMDLGRICATLSELHSLFYEPSPLESDFQFSHASFTDFLLDPSPLVMIILPNAV
ncbi:hypothetical protein BDP27DRAFT_1356943 [Rhodocollybia butyracea]|uniref:Nephrocystin 3-like N-terminal domain-containing protein n=1 Tax=Rhodocollybia butyracea TaxID=206335 RepID=A0A9P5UEP3_9AGAR|nr:hypothetical protein BDP27DRAFT_1356943 [Rhodocollybia butyracea]